MSIKHWQSMEAAEREGGNKAGSTARTASHNAERTGSVHHSTSISPCTPPMTGPSSASSANTLPYSVLSAKGGGGEGGSSGGRKCANASPTCGADETAERGEFSQRRAAGDERARLNARASRTGAR